jgi:hypothetical protein
VKAFVLFRDRVTYAKQCVDALDEADLDIHIVDLGSTWPEAVEWAVKVDANNVGFTHPYQLWSHRYIEYVNGSRQPYIVTDCDIIPPSDYDTDWVYMMELLSTHYADDGYKIGLGLRIDDLPDGYPHKAEVIEHERGLIGDWLIPQVCEAAVDTTLAMYRPLQEVPGFTSQPALRMMGSFQARHLTWYETAQTPEIEYYRANIVGGLTHWSRKP